MFFSFDEMDFMLGEGSGADFDDLDPWGDEADTDRSGLEGDLESMAESDPFEPDDKATEQFEDLDGEDVEVGESHDEENINTVDLDFDRGSSAELEPDYDPNDQANLNMDDATDSSEESQADDDLDEDDNSVYDEVGETDQWEEVTEWDEVLQDENIDQMDETFAEDMFYPDENDTDMNLNDEIEEEIYGPEHEFDPSDTEQLYDWPDDELEKAVDWVNEEPPIDFTQVDWSSFHEVSEGFEPFDAYDPPNMDFMGDDILELGNLGDDVFVDLFSESLGNDFFSWMDGFS